MDIPTATTPLLESGTQPPHATASSDSLLESIKRIQHVATLVAHGLALTSIGVALYWVYLPAMGGGGLSWKEGEAHKVFNWHPLLMVTTFAFMTVASLSFKTFKSANRGVRKATHATAWLVALVSGAVGVTAAFKSHNDPVNGFVANLYSLHSWIGSLVIFLYLLQFITAHLAIGFFFPNLVSSSNTKLLVLAMHRYIGPFIYVVTAATILLGIQEKEGFIGTCGYKVTSIDLWPFLHFFEISLVCRIGHLVGLIVLLEALLTTFSLHNFAPTLTAHTANDDTTTTTH
mmetsp:Transcript_9172/g.14229  ORF Transcript_9172/g.14229 Transcript_9172/m.14229 type:complete len:288 (+) Transcript_9172:163-1026(+)|eukprot:CAMPEP_0118712040 /NCGR_PEP_ID=MMETSP0800-20121206/24516_1 /TAXON_ID=210618 ORGANISM="Striatella unipunctata, Strain CCMP2910" /NCGR_SAMPLE_ID=MMETSP0800 /ASSEMBLY_ACC=CAM_ASM_000638 /LENGTH=287 /DNA_ID=CAMNT_0006616889 /DNA_START=88 /DNA_END=951 /DNA_ORIENTATION=-